MTQWRFFGDNDSASGVISDGGNNFSCLFSTCHPDEADAESIHQHKLYVAYTVSDIRAKISNHSGPAVSVPFRDDGTASTNVVASVSTDGWAEDTTGSDTIAANSLCGSEFDQTAGMHGDTYLPEKIMLTYEHASTLAPVVGFNAGTLSADGFVSLNNAFNATEANARTRIYRAANLSNLFTSTESLTGAWTGAVRLNGSSSSNLTVSMATGDVEDTTGTEALAATDDAGFIYDETTAGSISEGIIEAQLDTDETFQGTRFNAVTTREYQGFDGTSGGDTTADDNWLARIGSVSAGNLQTYVSTAGSGTRDVTLRIGSTDSTNLTISVTATGFAEDTTGSDSVADGDNVTISAASSGSSMTYQHADIELPWSAVGAVEKRPERMIPIVQHRPRALSARW
jgi:hypothetical protein